MIELFGRLATGSAVRMGSVRRRWGDRLDIAFEYRGRGRMTVGVGRC